jgi:hypothetical protein
MSCFVNSIQTGGRDPWMISILLFYPILVMIRQRRKGRAVIMPYSELKYETPLLGALRLCVRAPGIGAAKCVSLN